MILTLSQCCSCLFVSGRTVVYRSHYKRPQFPPKVDFGGPNYRLSHVASHVDWPSRTLLTVRPARQDAVYLRRMTTTALHFHGWNWSPSKDSYCDPQINIYFEFQIDAPKWVVASLDLELWPYGIVFLFQFLDSLNFTYRSKGL